MSRIFNLSLASTLAEEATRLGTPPDRFNDLTLQACLDEWTASWQPGVAADPRGWDIAKAKAAAVNAAGFRAQFSLLLDLNDEPECVANELLRRIELDAARRAAGPAISLTLSQPTAAVVMELETRAIVSTHTFPTPEAAVAWCATWNAENTDPSKVATLESVAKNG